MSDHYTKLIEEARAQLELQRKAAATYQGATFAGTRAYLVVTDELIDRLADAVEALVVKNEKLRNAENLLAMNAIAISQATGMSLDQASTFSEGIIRQATDHKRIRDIEAERDASRAQLDHLQRAYDEIRTEYAAYRADRKAEYQTIQDWAARVQQAKTLVELPGETRVNRRAIDEVTDS
ncbi:hypothetical protein IT072_02510 [Leifsonia sp. ZF2019]|uniref:hypothetical protein n=1 Tax=Leifsonia sp. ZF2019 TaxID=2781978 RepID=UPI001CBCBCF1|nr:hypothetical protein [Leifsonia sp. ZF2019]UAJ79970.1 hypothetical protein IT072_02510 [Leifsonia sp. ZF2019]